MAAAATTATVLRMGGGISSRQSSSQFSFRYRPYQRPSTAAINATSESLLSLPRTSRSLSSTMASRKIAGSTTTMAPAASSSRAWEVALASLAAVTMSASMIVFLPSTTQSEQQSLLSNDEPATKDVHFSKTKGSSQISVLRRRNTSYYGRSDGGGGGGSGGGGEGRLASVMLGHAAMANLGNIGPSMSTTTKSADKDHTRRRRAYDISIRAVKGGRVTMEDEYFVADGGRFVAVYDGHGGGGVSHWLKQSLYPLVQQYTLQYHAQQDDETVLPALSTQVAALRAAFGQAEQAVLANDALEYQGSTAVAVLLHECDDGHKTILSANVGDSRAILARRGRAVDLTRDHKPNEEREKARILSMGETIEWDALSKVHRVRNLSLSRAIGDRYAKPVVSGQVEIQHFVVDERDDDFVLLASDGLWDVMNSQEVVSFVERRLETELERVAKDDVAAYKLVLRRNMAQMVAKEALRRGSGDNICVCIVWLSDLEANKP